MIYNDRSFLTKFFDTLDSFIDMQGMGHTYMMDYMKAVSQMSPMEEATEITVECEKVKVDVSGKEQVCWMPLSLDSFGNDVEAAIMQ